LFRRAEQRARDRGKDMHMLVRINVRDGDARALDFPNLRDDFALDLFYADAAGEEGGEEAAQSWAEGAAVAIQQRRDGFGPRYGRAIDEDDVAANAEMRMRSGDRDGVVECGA